MKHTIFILNHSGDARVEFDSTDPVSLDEAKKVWDALKQKGAEFFKTSPGGDGGERLRAFDPNTDMIAVPKIVGG